MPTQNQIDPIALIRQLLRENGYIPALTIYQPWASLSACKAKQYETRPWETNFRGWILIHAGLKYDNCFKEEFSNAAHSALKEKLPDFTFMHELPRGEIIAIAELVGCRLIRQNPYDGVIHILDDTDAAVCINGYGAISGNEYLFGDWIPNRYAWEFANMTMLPEPIEAKGFQRLWRYRGIDCLQ